MRVLSCAAAGSARLARIRVEAGSMFICRWGKLGNIVCWGNAGEGLVFKQRSAVADAAGDSAWTD